MSKKNTRAGGKYAGSHTTVIPGAGILADIAHNCPYVTKISVGFIKGGLSPTRGIRRVKIAIAEGSLLVSVRDNISHQELRIYTSDVVQAKRMIIQGAKEAGFLVAGDK